MSSDLEIITAVFPQVNESNKEEGAPRTPFSGTIDDIGSDLGKIKEIGVNHVILGPTDLSLLMH
jgi:hypothetical protein